MARPRHGPVHAVDTQLSGADVRGGQTTFLRESSTSNLIINVLAVEIPFAGVLPWTILRDVDAHSWRVSGEGTGAAETHAKVMAHGCIPTVRGYECRIEQAQLIPIQGHHEIELG